MFKLLRAVTIEASTTKFETSDSLRLIRVIGAGFVQYIYETPSQTQATGVEEWS